MRIAPANNTPDSRRIVEPPRIAGHHTPFAQAIDGDPRESNSTAQPARRRPRMLAYGRVYENGHDLVSKKHSCPRQAHAAAIIDQETAFHEPLEFAAILGPHIHGIP
jgi:hypothetical protein